MGDTPCSTTAVSDAICKCASAYIVRLQSVNGGGGISFRQRYIYIYIYYIRVLAVGISDEPRARRRGESSAAPRADVTDEMFNLMTSH